MAKSSRVEMEAHRRDIIGVASRLLRERGESDVSVQAVMNEVGLTHGGFYKHFSSKDELMDIAAGVAFSELISDMATGVEQADSKAAAWEGFVDEYLSADQRADLAGGCANTALATDSTRAGDDSGLRAAYVGGVTKTLDALVQYQARADTSDARAARLRALITMVGALTLSRAVAGTVLADEFADSARRSLTGGQRLQ